LELDEGIIIRRGVVGKLKTVAAAQDATPSEVTPDQVIVNKVTIGNKGAHIFRDVNPADLQ
ncbi:MAG TPA: hypothetical protein VE641_13110, partial [Chthoniobacterales bacterium]|nr:hypothetical protein [Chthoniobacterales bacterium]